MTGRKTILFPSLLVFLLLTLITFTGFFQIHVIQRNINDLFRNEGEILFRHISREINLNLEYLSLLEQSSPVITPNFLNIMVYDEAIVEYLYGILRNNKEADLEKLPIQNAVIIDGKGKIIRKKGKPLVPARQRRMFIDDKRESVVTLPSGPDKPLLVGIRIDKGILFLSLDDEELNDFRRRFIISEIFQGEGKRFDIVNIRLKGASGKDYVSLTDVTQEQDVYLIAKPLLSKYLPNHMLEIYISKKPAREILKRTVTNFFVILTVLMVAGGLGTYGIFLLQRKHEKKIAEMEMEIELKDRLVSLGRLASGMAHEIKNPLNAIGLSVQRLKREFQPQNDRKEEYVQFVEIIRSELKRVDRIVEDFLLSARSHAPYMEEDLYTLVDEVLIVLRERAESQGIMLGNEIPKDIAVECQRERLKQVFYNIILNGIEAIGHDGQVKISARREGDSVVIAVRDSGPGVEKGNEGKIFEYHFTTKDKGMGLGLPVSYMIVKDHGGDLRATGQEGKGAVFLITLPTGKSDVDSKNSDGRTGR